MRVYVILDTRASSDHPLGEAVETFIRREDAERFVEGCAATIPSSQLPADRGAGAGGGRTKLMDQEPPRLQRCYSASTGV